MIITWATSQNWGERKQQLLQTHWKHGHKIYEINQRSKKIRILAFEKNGV